MDPNTALDVIRREVALILADEDGADVVALAEHMDALDGWLSAGGFLPKGWER